MGDAEVFVDTGIGRMCMYRIYNMSGGQERRESYRTHDTKGDEQKETGQKEKRGALKREALTSTSLSHID